MSSSKIPYKHRNIPNIETIEPYLIRNKSALNGLRDIYDRKIEYIPDYYQLLILSFERLYKGVYKELRNMGVQIPYIPDEEIEKGRADETGNRRFPHHFKNYAKHINKIIPLADSKEQYFDILDTINERFQLRYTSSRFTEDVPFEEFQTDFRRLETQTFRLFKGLET